VITVSSLSIKRGGKIVIHDFDFSWHRGEKLVLLGPNGAGKSSFALALSGMISIESGEILIDSEPISDYDLPSLRKKIGIVFQDPESQFVTNDVRQEIAFGLSNIKLTREEIKTRVETIINNFTLNELTSRDPLKLSGGEKQLVAIASICAMSPDYLIFDEVTSLLDRATRERIYRLWEESSLSLLIITQNFDEIKYGDKVILIENGEISFESSATDLKEKSLITTDEIIFKRLLEKNKESIPQYERILEILG